MRNYVEEVMNGADLAESFAALSNELRKLYKEDRSNNERILELNKQEDAIKNFIVYGYMKENGCALNEGFAYWEKKTNI